MTVTRHFTPESGSVLLGAGRRWSVAVLLAMLAVSTSPSGERQVRVIVGLKTAFVAEGRLRDPRAVLAQRAGIARAKDELFGELRGAAWTVEREFESIPYVALEAPPSTIEALEKSPRVAGVHEDRLMRASLAQSVPLIGGDIAWASGYTGTGWAVAIIDSGVDKSHPFLAGKVISEACFSSKKNCPNKTATQTTAGAARPCGFAPGTCAHGTHVAGIAAGSGANFSGVAKGTSLIAVQVFSKFSGAACAGTGEDPCGLAFTSDIVAGLERVYNLRGTFSIASVNMSLGGGAYSSQAACDADEPALKAALDNLRAAGIAPVAASGNESNPIAMTSPGCLSSAVSVGATSKADVVAPFSNSAPFLSLLAPGAQINSSIPGGGFAVFSGTSMAAPHVAGAWALARQSNPNATVTEILDALQLTGTPIFDARNGLTKPRINVDRVLFTCDAAAVPQTGATPLMVDFQATAARGTQPYTFSWDFDDGGLTGTGDNPGHLFSYPGDYLVAMSVQDAAGLTCHTTVAVEADGPRITQVRRKSDPYRLIVDGGGFVAGDTVRINGVAAPATVFKSANRLVAMKGAALKALLPVGVPAQVTVGDPNGLLSRSFDFTP